MGDRRRAILTLILWAFLGWGAASTDAREGELTPVVRTHAPLLASMIEEGRARSATFRRLVGEVEHLHGIVYVDAGTCQRRARSCLRLNVLMSGETRLLFVEVDPRQDRTTLIASIGHELQHAVEVLSNKQVNTDSAMYLFYRREGLQSARYFETEKARRTTIAVRAELDKKEAPRPAQTDSSAVPLMATTQLEP